MSLNSRTLSTLDHEKLRAVVDRAARCWMREAPHLDVLRAAVRRGRTAPPTEFPGDVITMNSRFALRNLSTGEWIPYELVYPEEEAVHRNRISVLSAAGTALLGARVGEEVVWTSSSGFEVALVQELLHQPEAALRSATRAAAIETRRKEPGDDVARGDRTGPRQQAATAPEARRRIRSWDTPTEAVRGRTHGFDADGRGTESERPGADAGPGISVLSGDACRPWMEESAWENEGGRVGGARDRRKRPARATVYSVFLDFDPVVPGWPGA